MAFASVLYPLAAAALLCFRRQLAWERGAMQLALYNGAMGLSLVLPKAMGADSLSYHAASAFAWLGYVPFLCYVLSRDSDYWTRGGFSSALMATLADAEW